MITHTERQKPLQINPIYAEWKRSVTAIFVVLVVLVAALLIFTRATPASARDMHRHHRICTGSPMPRDVCSMIYHQSRFVPGAKVSWATNKNLAVILKRESGFDWCAVNPSHHDCIWRGTNHSCGLFQRLPCVHRIFVSRVRQTRDGLAYIVHRYHAHPREARAHSDATGWY